MYCAALTWLIQYGVLRRVDSEFSQIFVRIKLSNLIAANI